ncbi:DUF1992 domain-containing protein [Georgenia sp. Z1344]|uniref:DnaJ family domain-containing protein n=1 Tax=Georgenia sp. Z1344 TaxID=3416706 RepID=UPI003CEFD3A2
MTQRKPPEMPTGSWVDQLIREAQERGEFDNLPGTGKPLPDIDQTDEDWWIRRKLRDENLPSDALLPPVLVLRKELAELPRAVRTLPTEEAVRERVAELNHRVAEWIRMPSGPVLPVGRADVEEIVRGWRDARQGRSGEGSADGAAVHGEPVPDDDKPEAREGSGVRRRRWWKRR